MTVVPILYRCPHERGVDIREVSVLGRCPYARKTSLLGRAVPPVRIEICPYNIEWATIKAIMNLLIVY